MQEEEIKKNKEVISENSFEKSELRIEPEKLEEERLVKQEIMRELELINLDDNLKLQAEQKANKISLLGQEDKVEHLLQIAKEKGIMFALKVAKDMNDPYILDIFHDTLVREGYYKKFVK